MMFSRKDVKLEEYQKKVNYLKQVGRAYGLTQEEIDRAYESSLDLEHRKRIIEGPVRDDESNLKWVRKILCAIMLFVGFYSITIYKPVSNMIERNIQEAIYPVMKLYRRATLPLINYFPMLTELYDESCLVENPYFKVPDMECWPCENARVVLNMTDSISNTHIGLPFFLKLPEPGVELSEIRNVYLTFRQQIDKNSGRIQSNLGWDSIFNLLKDDKNLVIDYPSTHVTWRINRMEVARMFRPLLKPPSSSQTPPHATAIGIERFLLVDGPKSPHYVVPSPEGANVFIKQLSGQRLIVLEPAPECRSTCRRLSFLLDECHILWYNWWYWRPRSLPVHNSSAISISFMGSTT